MTFFHLLNIYYSNIKKGNWKTLNYFYQNKIACFSNSYCINHFCYLQTIYWIQSFLLHWKTNWFTKRYLLVTLFILTTYHKHQQKQPKFLLHSLKTKHCADGNTYLSYIYMAVLWVTVNGWAYQLENGVVYSRSVLAHIIKEHRKLCEVEGVWDPGEDLETSPRQYSWKKSYNKTICKNFGLEGVISDFKIY